MKVKLNLSKCGSYLMSEALIKGNFCIRKWSFILLMCFMIIMPFFSQSRKISSEKLSLNKKKTEMQLYKNPAYPIEQRVEDLLSRMTLKEKIGQMNMPCLYKKRIGWGLDARGIDLYDVMTYEERKTQIEGCRKLITATHNDQIGPIGGFFTLTDRVGYRGTKFQAELFNELQHKAMNETRLGIPLLQIEEGTHGFMCTNGTIFPEGLAIGSSWNLELINKIYGVVAKEARATGAHMLGTLVIEPNRDPRMGRNQETYSEDIFMCSKIAGTIVDAVQGDDVSANDKAVTVLSHYPGQSEPLSGFERGAMNVSERKLREVFLPSWVEGIKRKNALAVMATYPAIDGTPVHGSDFLLRKILRHELGFKGIVLSEGSGISTLIDERTTDNQKEAGQIAVKSGVNVGISFEDAYLKPLIESVEEGKVAMSDIDDAVRHILYVKFKLGLFDNPYVDPEYAQTVVHSKGHQELALEAAREGIVLLRNESNLLPLKKDLKSIAVIGPLADTGIDQIGDYIPHHITHELVTVLTGIKNKLSPDAKINYVRGCEVLMKEYEEIEKAKEAAKNAEVVIVVLGEKGDFTNGESRDVASLDLTGYQEELLKAVYSTGTPVVLVLINGRALSINWASKNVPAIVEAWMCGEQGGNAVADVLFGDYNPSGKLPVTFPRHSGQLPVYYDHVPSKNRWIKKGYVDMPATPLYAFGHGLSYTKFECSNLKLSTSEIKRDESLNITLDVKNVGDIKGKEVIQLYINDEISSVTTPAMCLRGFEKIELLPGQTKSISFTLSPESLALLNKDMKWVVEPGKFKVIVGNASDNIHLQGEFYVR